MATTTEQITASPSDPSTGRRRRVPVVALLALVVVLAAEFGARALTPYLPPIDDWNQREAAIEYAQMQAIGHVDAVVVGSSVAHFGFEPDDFSARTGLSAYNAALPGSGAASIAQWTRDFVEPMLSPKVVIIALTSRDLNDNGPVQAEHYSSYIASEARRRALRLGSLGERLERAIDERSALVRLRRYFRRPASVAKQLEGQAALVRPVALGAHGEARFPEADYAFSNDLQRATWEREALQNFDMTSSLAIIGSLVAELRGKGIRVLIVDMPVVEGIYGGFHPHGRADLDRYRAALATLRAPVIAISSSGWEIQGNFVDAIHLNRAGAHRFSRSLASRLASL